MEGISAQASLARQVDPSRNATDFWIWQDPVSAMTPTVLTDRFRGFVSPVTQIQW
jgi:hypothetical protein